MKEMYTALVMVRKGQHPTDVARKLRVTPVTVRNWCRKAGIPYKIKPPGPEPMPPAVRELAATMVIRDGKSLAAVADALYTSKATVSKCCTEYRRRHAV